MQEFSHVFDLSFIPKVKGNAFGPAIVCTIHTSLLPIVLERLEIVARYNVKEALRYFRGEEVPFEFSQKDMFGLTHIGYGAVAVIRVEESSAQVIFKLHSRERAPEIAMTFRMLMEVLNSDLRGYHTSNVQQLLNFHTCVEYRTGGYGHALGGRIYPDMIRWLRTYGATQTPHRSIMGPLYELPEEVLRAMKLAWVRLGPPDMARYANQCRGYIHPDGRFSLECFGDACDIAIYPETSFEETYQRVGGKLDCHNLDNADQQLTLIAGLAKLSELARKGLEKAEALKSTEPIV